MTKTSVKALALITCLSALPLMVGLTGCVSDRTIDTPQIEDNGTTNVTTVKARTSVLKTVARRSVSGKPWRQALITSTTE